MTTALSAAVRCLLQPLLATLLLLLLQAPPAPSSCPPAVLKLSPLPQSFAARDGQQCALDDRWVISLPVGAAAAGALRRPAEVLAAGIRAQTGLQIHVVSSRPGPGSMSIALHLTAPPLGAGAEPQAFGATDEGYRLDIDVAAVAVTATTVRGLQYGTRTFLQLLGKTGQVPAGVIEDKPDLPVRGSSRGRLPTTPSSRPPCSHMHARTCAHTSPPSRQQLPLPPPPPH